jgi:Ni/Co efflux regulator RcnB
MTSAARAYLLAASFFTVLNVAGAFVPQTADAQTRRQWQEREQQDDEDLEQDDRHRRQERSRDGAGKRYDEYQRREAADCARLRQDARKTGSRLPAECRNR